MSEFQFALLALQGVAATAKAAAAAKEVYDKFVQQARRTKSMTDEESAELDARAAAIFSSPEQELSGR